MTEIHVFSILAFLVISSSILVVTLKNPVASAIFLVLDLFFLAGIYILHLAEFVAAIQVIVYAGAIVVLFLFVIMLLNLENTDRMNLKLSLLEKSIIIFFTFSLISLLVWIFNDPESFSNLGVLIDRHFLWQKDLPHFSMQELGQKLFEQYLWPFEISSFLILLVTIASIWIASKQAIDVSPRELKP